MGGSRKQPRRTPLDLSCESVERSLAEHGGGVVSPAVRDHLKRCPRCRKEWESALPLAELVGRHLEGARPAAADPFFRRAVMKSIQGELPPIRRQNQGRGRRALAAAVVLGLTLGLSHAFLTAFGPSSPPSRPEGDDSWFAQMEGDPGAPPASEEKYGNFVPVYRTEERGISF